MARRGQYGSSDIGDISDLDVNFERYKDSLDKMHSAAVAYGKAEKQVLDEALKKRADVYETALKNQQKSFNSHISKLNSNAKTDF